MLGRSDVSMNLQAVYGRRSRPLPQAMGVGYDGVFLLPSREPSRDRLCSQKRTATTPGVQ